MYIHELRDWPRFYWNRERLADPLASVRHRQGRLIGRMEGWDSIFSRKRSANSVHRRAQEQRDRGEKLDAEQVRSSIARRLGMDIGALKAADRNVEGVVEMMLDATRHYGRRSPPNACSRGMPRCFRPAAAA